MDFESDVAYVVVEFLAQAKCGARLADVLVEAPFEKRKVAGVLFALASCGFLEKKAGAHGDQDASYSVTSSVTAYHIIKLGEMGVDMSALSSMVKLSEKQKQAAMSLAMQTEKLAEMEDEARAKRAEALAKSAPAVALPRDAVVETLERLAMASDLSIKEMAGGSLAPEVMSALLDAKLQAEKALAKYQEQLSKAGPEHLGF